MMWIIGSILKTVSTKICFPRKNRFLWGSNNENDVIYSIHSSFAYGNCIKLRWSMMIRLPAIETAIYNRKTRKSYGYQKKISPFRCQFECFSTNMITIILSPSQLNMGHAVQIMWCNISQHMQGRTTELGSRTFATTYFLNIVKYQSWLGGFFVNQNVVSKSGL